MFDVFSDVEFGTPVTVDGEKWVLIKKFHQMLSDKPGFALAVKESDTFPATPKLIQLPDDYLEQLKKRAEKSKEDTNG